MKNKAKKVKSKRITFLSSRQQQQEPELNYNLNLMR